MSEQLIQNEQSPPIYLHRRTFAKAIGISAIVGPALLVADTINHELTLAGNVEAKIWPHNEPSLTFLEGAEYAGQSEIALFLPGFGDVHGAREAIDWKASGELPADMPVGVIDYSNQGANIDDIVDLIKKQVDTKSLTALNLFGTSMGGLYSVAVAAKLGVPVRSLILCSSPSSFSHAYFGDLSHVVSEMPTNRGLATITKFVASAYRSHQTNPDFSLQHVASDAVRRTLTGGDPVAEQNQLKAGYGVNIYDRHLIKDLRKVFQPGFSHVAYVASKHPHTDTIVQVIISGDEYKILFNDQLGVSFKLFGANYQGHANVEVSATDTKGWAHAIYALTDNAATQNLGAIVQNR